MPHRGVLSACLFLVLCAPVSVASAPAVHDPAGDSPYQQEFVITAYYSPLPDQCCFVKGSYEEDVTLNGGGTNGASGRQVRPGMAAAPKEFPFGTRITLPGLGTVTVEDRGGAIHSLDSGAQRLDLWVGTGEEGLARALAFGVRHVVGTVYPLKSEQPPELFSLEALPAPAARLKPYVAYKENLLSLHAKQGDRGLSVLMVQQRLQNLGYFRGDLSGFYGPQTRQALQAFIDDYGVGEPSDTFTQKTAAYIVAATQMNDGSVPLPVTVSETSDASAVRDAQRTLRFLGYYRGRTNGTFDNKLRDAIFRFQQDQSIVASVSERGAGIAGPRTRSAITLRWRARIVASRAQDMLLLAKIDTIMQQKGYAISRFLTKGDSGTQVRILQRLLAQRGYMKSDRVTGFFGAETEKAVIAYQLEMGIIGSAKDRAAGYVGPGTKNRLSQDIRTDLFRKVRGNGLQVL